MIFVLETFDNEKLYIVLENEQTLLNALNSQKFIHLSYWQGWLNISSIKRYCNKAETQNKELNDFECKIWKDDWFDDYYIKFLREGKTLSSSSFDRFILSYNSNILWDSTLDWLNKQKKKKLN